jgi:hypothetical protein
MRLAHFLSRQIAPNNSASTSSESTTSILPCRFIRASSASASPGAWNELCCILLVEGKTYIPPFKTTSIQEFFKLSRSVVGCAELPSDFSSTLLRRLLRSIFDLAGPRSDRDSLPNTKTGKTGCWRRDVILKNMVLMNGFSPYCGT